MMCVVTYIVVRMQDFSVNSVCIGTNNVSDG